MLGGALLFSGLVALTTLTLFFGLWSLIRRSDPISQRLAAYRSASGGDGAAEAAAEGTERPLSSLERLAAKLDLASRIDVKLSRANSRLTPFEFIMLSAGLGVAGFLLGAVRAGALIGLAVGAVLCYAPSIYLSMSISKRRRAFTQQLPDVLVLMVGGLRAGYGLVQSIQTLAEQLPEPAAFEFGRVLRAVNLGVAVEQALGDLVQRIGTDEVDLVVTAIVVQQKMGGNLAQTLELIAGTIRDRIDIHREVAALTAEEQLTGYVLTALPTMLALGLSLINPGFLKPLFAPGMMRLLPIGAITMQVLGFIVMRRMLVIEV